MLYYKYNVKVKGVLSMEVKVSQEVAEAIEELSGMCAGFHHEMYCKMNKYLFNQAQDTYNPRLEVLRKTNLFNVVDAIRYGYVTK